MHAQGALHAFILSGVHMSSLDEAKKLCGLSASQKT